MPAPNPSIGEAEFRGVNMRIDYHRFRALERRTGKKMQRLIAEWGLGLGLEAHLGQRHPQGGSY